MTAGDRGPKSIQSQTELVIDWDYYVDIIKAQKLK